MAVLNKFKAAVRLAVRPFEEADEKRRKAPLYTTLHSNEDADLPLREVQIPKSRPRSN